MTGARTARVEVLRGLEPFLIDELTGLGLSPREVPGGALVDATPEALAALDHGAWCADRVWLRLGRVATPSLDRLAQGVRALGWRDVLDPRQELAVQVTGTGRSLRRGPVVTRKVQIAVRDAMRGPRGMSTGRPPPPMAVQLVLEGDHAVVWVDAGGGPLHKRGWRPETAKAPLRETVAAAVLRAAGWRPGVPLVDPMCGAGTFAIEAARRAAGLTPRLRPEGAWRRFPCFARARVPTPPRRTPVTAPILAADRDPGAVQAARRNADRAGVGSAVQVAQIHFAEHVPPGPGGLLIANPPWGHRIGNDDAMPKMIAAWRSALGAWNGWSVAWILPDSVLGARGFDALGPGFTRVARCRHGGVPVSVGLRSATRR